MAVKKYAYSDAIQLTPHFNSSEFRCKLDKKHNAQHDYYVDDALVQGLERLFTKIPELFGIKVSKICITSGYRCSTHDIAVGGNGSGPHTGGWAADFIVYDENGAPVSSKMVCCAAQELGFRGIANITSAYIYTHCDMKDRVNAASQHYNWYGNEVYGNGTVTINFWTYYGLTPKTNKSEPEVVKLSGIDVSKYQGNIDFEKAAKAIDFAVLRAGFGRLSSQEDEKFQCNYDGFKKQGTPIGAYWYCYATSADEARKEAEAYLAVLKGKQFELPIFYDILEDDHIPKLKAAGSISKLINEIVPAFCDVLEQNGYFIDNVLQDSTTYVWGGKDFNLKQAFVSAHGTYLIDWSLTQATSGGGGTYTGVLCNYLYVYADLLNEPTKEFIYDFGQPRMMNRLVTTSGSAYPCTLFKSDDNETWTQVAAINTGGSSTRVSAEFSPTAARYWKTQIGGRRMPPSDLGIGSGLELVGCFDFVQPQLKFNTAPPAGSAIKVIAKSEFPIKNSNWIIEPIVVDFSLGRKPSP